MCWFPTTGMTQEKTVGPKKLPHPRLTEFTRPNKKIEKNNLDCVFFEKDENEEEEEEENEEEEEDDEETEEYSEEEDEEEDEVTSKKKNSNNFKTAI